MIKNFFLALIAFYQSYISIFSFGSCRYYPTCSEYAKWQINHDSFFHALFAILIRILRCNKFFIGGIEYPLIKKKFYKLPYVYVTKRQLVKVKFWFVPFKEGYFHIVKTF